MPRFLSIMIAQESKTIPIVLFPNLGHRPKLACVPKARSCDDVTAWVRCSPQPQHAYTALRSMFKSECKGKDKKTKKSHDKDKKKKARHLNALTRTERSKERRKQQRLSDLLL
ncbi:hypothetical protein COCON_G00187590 [Conger conger]|uniref:Uncharacterized protein n=1 Tax=Conger conger TaxID=82655 RepID=A0A9Q1HRZ4_CONCO|nr:hypothetical protein COCON_G00187590 [Conger conger]